MISPDELAFLMILAGSAQGQWRPMKVRVRSCPTADSLSRAREQHGRAPDRRASARPLLKVVHRNRPGRNRTCNPRFWRPVLYQLSYGPTSWRASLKGWLKGIEPSTSGATVQRSNRLSYSHQDREEAERKRRPRMGQP